MAEIVNEYAPSTPPATARLRPLNESRPDAGRRQEAGLLSDSVSKSRLADRSRSLFYVVDFPVVEDWLDHFACVEPVVILALGTRCFFELLPCRIQGHPNRAIAQSYNVECRPRHCHSCAAQSQETANAKNNEPDYPILRADEQFIDIADVLIL